MVQSRGFDSTGARVKSSAWGTSVSCNVAAKQIGILTESLDSAINYINDDSLTGNAFRQQSDKGAVTVAGAWDTYLRYDGLELDIAMVMGRAGASPSQIGSGPAGYYNDFRLGDSLEGYMVTLCIDKQVQVDEFDSLKYNGMTISGDAGDRLKISFDMIGRRQQTDTGTNSDLSSVTEPLPRKYVMFEDCKFLINAESGSALNEGVDDVYPASFTISLNNNMTGDLTAENDPYVDEPLRNDFGEITGTLTIPKFKNTLTRDAFLAGTRMKFAIRCISTTQICDPGQGSYYYEFNMYMPSVIIDSSPTNIAGPGNVPSTFNFRCERAISAPDGMDGSGGKVDSTAPVETRSSITSPLVIETKSTASENPFA